MINIIISVDPTTKFLYGIIDNLTANNIECNIIEVEPTDDSYKVGKQKISEISINTTILFLGHGQSNQLYGGESEKFDKKPLITNKEMSFFKDKFLFALACDSSILLKETFQNSGIKKSIGFGMLPTELSEIEGNKILSKSIINDKTIDSFKNKMVETVSSSLIESFASNKDFLHLYNYLRLLINQEINNAVLIDNDRGLADLLFKMRTDMKLY